MTTGHCKFKDRNIGFEVFSEYDTVIWENMACTMISLKMVPPFIKKKIFILSQYALFMNTCKRDPPPPGGNFASGASLAHNRLQSFSISLFGAKN